MVRVMCEEYQYHLVYGTIEVGGDNVGALCRAFEPRHLISPNHTHYDLTYTIQSMIKVSHSVGR